MPEASEIIQEGVNKLTEYETRLDDVPANILATRKILRFHSFPLFIV